MPDFVVIRSKGKSHLYPLEMTRGVQGGGLGSIRTGKNYISIPIARINAVAFMLWHTPSRSR
jgi:hypothetical protein